MELAERLHMTLWELDVSMSAAELTKWRALDEERAAERRRADAKAEQQGPRQRPRR